MVEVEEITLGLVLNSGSNSWKTYLGNFVAVWVAQLVFRLYDLTQTGKFPTPFELYSSAIAAAVATLIFYGYNKLTTKKEVTS